MTNEEKLAREQEKTAMAGYAQQVLSNPAYKQALIVLRGDLIQKISKVPVKDVEELQELRRMIGTLDRFEEVFERVMTIGSVAEKNISKLQQIINKVRNK